jgi:prepilin-type N-terminal cleavage/methylation domain-containing protein
MSAMNVSYISKTNDRGFSLIELIVVIVIAGIVAAVAIPRFTGISATAIAGTTDALLTTIRQAQQAALGRSNVSFTIAAGTGTWEFTVLSGADVLSAQEVPSSGIKLETGSSVWTTDTCAAGSSFNTAVSSFELEFDPEGNLATFNNTGVGLQTISPTFNGVRICLNDTVAYSVCVSPAGYAYGGNCER